MDSDLTTITSADATKSPQDSARRVKALLVAAIVGALVLAAYPYAATRWAPLDQIALLLILYAVLLVSYAVLAVFGVRAGVVAPFVVAALLLPWVCAAAALVGVGQRADDALEQLSDELSLEDGAGVAPDEASGDFAAPAAEDLAAPLEEAAPSEEEVFPSAPTQVSPSTRPGEPVLFDQALSPGGDDKTTFEVTVTGLECGAKSLPKAEYPTDGSDNMTTAKAASGNMYCLIHSQWRNIGKVSQFVAMLGTLEVAGKQIPHESRDLYRGFPVMEQRGILTGGEVAPGATVEQIDVYEVPEGTVPEGVWISQDQPTVLAAIP